MPAEGINAEIHGEFRGTWPPEALSSGHVALTRPVVGVAVQAIEKIGIVVFDGKIVVQLDLAVTDRLGVRNMAILPYRDRLALLGRCLQQLVMESLGKMSDRDGAVVHQGLTVFGNKGSTDQHAYVQQLVDGVNDAFVTFVNVSRTRDDKSLRVAKDATSGDYLHGCWQGTRDTIADAGRESITITLDELTPRSVGSLIALFERAVGTCAELINVNAYDQPGLEAGERATERVIELQQEMLKYLRSRADSAFTAEELARDIGVSDDVEAVFHGPAHLAANADHGIQRVSGSNANPKTAKFGVVSE